MNNEDVETIISEMDVNKPTTYNNIPPKMLVEIRIFVLFIYAKSIMILYITIYFPMHLKMQISHLLIKKTKLQRKITIDLLVYFLLFQKCLKGKCTTKFTYLFTNIYRPFFVASGRDTVRNSA